PDGGSLVTASGAMDEASSAASFKATPAPASHGEAAPSNEVTATVNPSVGVHARQAFQSGSNTASGSTPTTNQAAASPASGAASRTRSGRGSPGAAAVRVEAAPAHSRISAAPAIKPMP